MEASEVQLKSSGRPARSVKPVSYNEESIIKKIHGIKESTSGPAKRKKNVNGSSKETAPPKKSGKKKVEPENGSAEELLTEEDAVPRKRKNVAEKANGTKAKKQTSRQKKADADAVAADTDDVEDTVPEPKIAKKETKAASKSAKKVKDEGDEINEDGEGSSKATTSKAPKKKTTKSTVVEDEPEEKDDEDQIISKNTAQKVSKTKKKGKPSVASNVEDENIADVGQVASKTVASKLVKGKKTKAAAEPNEAVIEDNEKVNDKKKLKRTKEPTSKVAVVKKSKRKLAEPVIDQSKVKQNASTTQVQPEPAVEQIQKSKLNIETNVNEKWGSPTDKVWKTKISSWNVAGLRALVQKNGLEFIEREKPDILCLQETKCTVEQVPEGAKIEGYHKYWLGTEGGRAGVGLYSKVMPYNIYYGINDNEMDEEARVITAEYTKFFVVCVYVPNAGRKLITLPKRLDWDQLFQSYIINLNKTKPVIICGDLNVAHLEIDLANPKSNTKNAGFTKQERDGMTKLLGLGFIDSFRQLYPDRTKAYTFWTYIGNARAKNVGWRLDYFVISEKLKENVVDNLIRSEVTGSDHCPITLLLNI